MKKSISFLLSLIMTLSIATSLPVTVSAADSGVCGENLTWVFDEGTLTISGSGDMTDFTSQSDVAWSKYRFDIISVIIEDGVTSIGDYAFAFCTEMVSYKIPDTVTSYGDYSFNGCTYFGAIKMSDNVTSIGDYVFAGCTALYSVIFSPNITHISNSAFESCSGLEVITIPDNVTSIGDSAFAYCTSLEEITIPDKVTTIGESAFESCSSIKKFTMGKSVKSIKPRAFYSCTSLVSIIMPDSLTDISDSVFYNCPKLKYVFFTGSEDEWLSIKIASYNPALENASIHYNTTNHTPSDWIVDKEATCLEKGTKHKKCTACGEELETGEVAKTTHKSGSWTIVEKASASSSGKKIQKCSVCGERIGTAKIAQLRCSKPTIKTISNTEKTIKITWDEISGAKKYVVYRKVKDGSYSIVGTSIGTSYNDKTVEAGKQYYYVVKAANSAGLSEASASETA